MFKERYTVFEGKNGKYYFNLKAANHKIILRSSDSYFSKKDATKAILWIQSNCTNPQFFERRVAKNGEPYFVFKDDTVDILGISETYSSKYAMENGIKSVQENGITKTILGIDDVFFEVIINRRQFELQKGRYKRSYFLELGGFVGPRFCLFQLNGFGRREILPNQEVDVVGCLEFEVVRND